MCVCGCVDHDFLAILIIFRSPLFLDFKTDHLSLATSFSTSKQTPVLRFGTDPPLTLVSRVCDRQVPHSISRARTRILNERPYRMLLQELLFYCSAPLVNTHQSPLPLLPALLGRPSLGFTTSLLNQHIRFEPAIGDAHDGSRQAAAYVGRSRCMRSIENSPLFLVLRRSLTVAFICVTKVLYFPPSPSFALAAPSHYPPGE